MLVMAVIGSLGLLPYWDSHTAFENEVRIASGLGSYVLVLAFFANMFFSRIHRMTSLVVIFGALCGIFSILMMAILAYSFMSYYYPFAIVSYAQLSFLSKTLVLISLTLLYAEFRHNKKFRRFAVFALILYLLSMSFDVDYNVSYNEISFLVDVLYYVAWSLYLFALSFVLKSEKFDQQPNPEV